MKKTILYLFFLCFVSTYSQRQAANWYFGENAGINFDANNNVTALDDGQLDTLEGCSSISDNDGNLQFYTDGKTVYTSTHAIMQGGTNLLGDESSTQSAIVIPRPNNPNIYYIFTVGSNNSNNGMKYSVVDMSMNGGLGQVTIRNQNLLSVCAEKIAAVLKDCDTGAIWVVGLSNSNGTSSTNLDTFHAFEVTNAGVNTTAVTSTFTNFGTDARGYLKISPDGSKLACANVDNGMYLFDFDVDTGTVSNLINLFIPGTDNQPYGAEFSPDSQVLYVTASNDNFGPGSDSPNAHSTQLVQYDLNARDVSNPRHIVDSGTGFRSALQLGPDGKIYRTMSATYQQGLPFLSTINNPNELGAACVYIQNSVSLAGNNATQGLPPFIASFFVEKIDIIRNGTDTTQLDLCTGDTYTLTADDIPGATYVWSLNGRVLPETDYDLVVDEAGTYELVIDFNTGDCERLEGEAIVSFYDVPIANPVGSYRICDDDNDGSWDFDLTEQDDDILNGQDNTVFSVHYFESLLDAQNNVDEITGLFSSNAVTPIFARVHNIGNINCYDITSFNIEVFNTPIANTVPPFELCDDNADGNNTNGQIEINLLDFDIAILDGQNALDYEISYHSSQAGANTGDSPLPNLYYNQTPFQEEIFVRIENRLNEDCYDTTSFDVIINPIPPSFDASLIQCDEDGTVDGFTVFNLNEAFDDLTGNATNVFIEFYESLPLAEAGNTTPVNADAYFNTANPQVLYARVIDDTSLCHSIAELTLEVSTTQINNYQAPEVCDELESEDGINTFDLDQFTADIQADNGLAFPVTYYETYNDALLEQNELATPYTNIIPYTQTIYSRVENNNACYGIGEVYLTINPLPQLEEDETILYCLNIFPDTISVNAGIIGDSPNNYTYNWSSGQNTYEIDINATGSYTVTAMNIHGCTKTRTITVEPSNIATIESIEIIDASQNNSITVLVSGEGQYEYALFDQNGDLYAPYQTSNYFTNMPPGLYTVSVRDVKNNCGIVEDLVSVIGFPNVFTPNGDGTNDTWQVKGISQQFQPNTKILIFDRYGKLVKQLNPVGPGWDGTYNGQLMPVSDYWFTVQLQDGRLFKSHFTLKR